MLLLRFEFIQTMQLYTKRYLQSFQIGENDLKSPKNDFKQKYSGCFHVFLMAFILCAALTATSRAGQGLPENEKKTARDYC
jgi:hypothetical protein